MMKRSIFLSYVAAGVAAIMAPSCAGGSESACLSPDTVAVDTAGLSPDVAEVVMAVATDNPGRFAAAVSYPLERPYPLRDVEDSAGMTKYYPVMVDDSLRSVITGARASDWSEAGWRGWTLRNGEYLWVDGQIYAVNYVSPREREIIDSLSREEINSLQPDMRRGWHPAFCLRAADSDMVFRVDQRRDDDSAVTGSPYRLAIYRGDVARKGRPMAVMRGRMEVEGSAGVRTYFFEGRDGSRAVYVYDRVSDDDPQQILMVSAAGDTAVHPVSHAYWRDFLHRKHHQ